MIARYWILVTFLDKEDEDDMLSHPGLSRILGFRPYSLIGRRSVGGLPMLARASLKSPKPGKRPTFDRTFSRSHGLGPDDPSPGVLLNSLPPHWPTSPRDLMIIRGILHQEGVNSIGTSSQGTSFVRIVLIQVRFLLLAGLKISPTNSVTSILAAFLDSFPRWSGMPPLRWHSICNSASPIYANWPVGLRHKFAQELFLSHSEMRRRVRGKGSFSWWPFPTFAKIAFRQRYWGLFCQLHQISVTSF